jgi:hypothetical protein
LARTQWGALIALIQHVQILCTAVFSVFSFAISTRCHHLLEVVIVTYLGGIEYTVAQSPALSKMKDLKQHNGIVPEASRG